MFFSKKKSGSALDDTRKNGLHLSGTGLSYLKKHPIAYFCAEYAIDDSISFYAGGLGILAGDILIEAESKGIPLAAFGLFYRKGFSSYPKVKEGEEIIDPVQSGFTLIKNEKGEPIMVSIEIEERRIYCQAWARSWGEVTLYLLDTNVGENEEADRKITTYLYPDSFESRMIQEIVLGVGGVKLLRALNISPSIYHLNEGHTALAALALALSFQEDNPEVGNLAEAVGRVRHLIVGTKHTILPGAGIFFTKEQCAKYLSSYLRRHAIGDEEFFAMGSEDNNLDVFSTTLFLLRTAARVNAVSKVHSLFESQFCPECDELLPITNGISKKRWGIPALEGAKDDETFWKIHTEAKADLFQYIKDETGNTLDPNALTIVWARRIAEYKQPLLIFKDVERLKRILSNGVKPVNIIISGNAYAGDAISVMLLENVLLQIKNLGMKNVIYLPHYSIAVAGMLTKSADVWLNTPQKGKEASGTSGMKSALNGTLQLSVADGWFEEVKSDPSLWSLNDENTAEYLYDILEKEVIPTYFKRDAGGYPKEWILKMRKTRDIILNNYTSERMLSEYMSKLYFPNGLNKN